MAIKITIPKMLFVVVLFYSLLPAQDQVIKNYRGFQVQTVPHDAVWTNSGKIAVTGITADNNANWNSFIAIFDSTYDCLWAKILDYDPWDISWKIHQTHDGGYAFCGYTGSILGPVDFCIFKFDSLGDLQFAKSIGSSSNDVGFYSIKENDLGFLLLGHTNGFGATEYDVMLVKIDSIGNLEWAKTINYSGSSGSHDSHESIIRYSLGHVLVNQCSYNTVITKFDSLWNNVWAKEISYLPSRMLLPVTVIQTNDSALVVLGNVLQTDLVWDDVYLMKLDNLGNIEWAKRLGLKETNHNVDVQLDARSVVQIESEEYIVVAHAFFDSGGIAISTPTIWKIGAQGNLIWVNTTGYKTAVGGSYAVTTTPDYGYLYWNAWGVPGSDSGLATIIKFDSAGATCISDTFAYIVIDSFINPSITPITSTINSINPTVNDLTPVITSPVIEDSVVCEYELGIQEDYRAITIENSEVVGVSTFFTDQIMIEFSGFSFSPVKIALYDVSGKLVYEAKSQVIPYHLIIAGERIKRLPVGVYFLLVSAQGKKICRTKLVKISD